MAYIVDRASLLRLLSLDPADALVDWATRTRARPFVSPVTLGLARRDIGASTGISPLDRKAYLDRLEGVALEADGDRASLFLQPLRPEAALLWGELMSLPGVRGDRYFDLAPAAQAMTSGFTLIQGDGDPWLAEARDDIPAELGPLDLRSADALA